MEEVKTRAVTESEDLSELFAALAKAQSEMEGAAKDSNNPFYKSRYAGLASVIKASRPALSKNGLCVIQRILMDETKNESYLLTRLGHASGQWMESKMLILPPKTDIQSIGSYITYIRRYSYASIVGVAAGDDDDGEAAMSEARKKISQEQIDEFLKLAERLDPAETVNALKFAQCKDLADIPLAKYDTIMKTLTQKLIKANKEERQ